MPRPETLTMFKSVDEKAEALAKEIASLRESRSEGGGKSTGLREMWGYVLAAVLFVGWVITTVIQLRGR